MGGKASPEANRRAVRAWKERNREHVRAQQKRDNERRYAANRASGTCVLCQKAPARADRIVCQPCQERTNWAARKRKYGITREQFEALLEKQEERCGICSVTIGRDAHVDHDHESKQVRGLLCAACNMGLGYMRDSSQVLESAAAYLKKWGK